MILDSSILIAAERRRFDLIGFFSAHSNDTIITTAITGPRSVRNRGHIPLVSNLDPAPARA